MQEVLISRSAVRIFSEQKGLWADALATYKRVTEVAVAQGRALRITTEAEAASEAGSSTSNESPHSPSPTHHRNSSTGDAVSSGGAAIVGWIHWMKAYTDLVKSLLTVLQTTRKLFAGSMEDTALLLSISQALITVNAPFVYVAPPLFAVPSPLLTIC